MKKLTLSLLAGLLAVVGTAQAKDASEAVRALMLADLQMSAAADLHINNVINWKVGEYTEYNIEAMGMPVGTMKKFVASEEGNNIWLVSDADMMGQKQKVEALMDRATAQILEMRQNGQKVDVPNDPIELIDQESTSITVPAGTFEVIHITAKSKQIKKLEVWANPRDIALDGGAQMMVDAGMIAMTMKLTKFGGR